MLLFYEGAQLAICVKKGWLGAWVEAIGSTLSRLPETLTRRRRNPAAEAAIRWGAAHRRPHPVSSRTDGWQGGDRGQAYSGPGERRLLASGSRLALTSEMGPMRVDKEHLTVAIVAACPLPLARGTPVRIRHVAESLANRGHDIHVITYHLGSGELSQDVKVHRTPRVPTYRRLSPGPSYQKLLVMDPLLTAKVARLLRTMPFDVIHAHPLRRAHGCQACPDGEAHSIDL